MLSPREAALRLGISYPTIKQWLYRGKVKAVKTPGGHYRIPEDELDEFLAEEPFCKAKLMRFSRIIEFDPVQHQPVLSDWFAGTQA